ncbi:liver specific protein 1 [Plasmodium berghei]|uniref:Liver specific protein 1 n=3 Tax=Plasmodium berghei TaxID=5821 RepID=A0A509AN41_PLABA|nr:liver specific protein 1 [Plasmodium berghei ANKA]SCL94866.1 liver specific protein 1 [Plasmodium berghei]SCM16121.1 liver specific protein 1 [Plasmodium berghei]SCM17917.1 liver specific protein 1 [Plasmodium berghei]SCN26263.1 liver specific protein 1 [Plasmodium berghei]VUC56243.1 liver specific protein 1 [Plasmodium berghei ANKA]|eukprot:XP_034422045.1 liver specific protein 1 [Plasmodium berghei ANKA]
MYMKNMKRILAYSLFFLYILRNNVLSKKNREYNLLGNAHKSDNIVNRLQVITEGKYRDVLSEVNKPLLSIIENNESVSLDILLSTIKLLDDKNKETDDLSKKKEIEQTIIYIKNAIKNHLGNVENNEENDGNDKNDITKTKSNKSNLMLKLDNYYMKRDLENLKKKSNDIALRKNNLGKKFKKFSTSSESLLFGAPGDLNLSDDSVKELNNMVSIKILRQRNYKDNMSFTMESPPETFNKLVDLYTPLLDFNLDSLEKYKNNEIKYYTDSKSEIFYLLRDNMDLGKFFLKLPISKMPNAKPNDNISESSDADNKIYTYVNNNLEKDKNAKEYSLGAYNTNPVYTYSRKKKKIPINKKNENSESASRVSHLFQKKMDRTYLNKPQKYYNHQNGLIHKNISNEYNRQFINSNNENETYYKKDNNNILFEIIIKSHLLTNNDVCKKIIIIKKGDGNDSIENNMSEDARIIYDKDFSKNCIQYSKKNDELYYVIPLIHFNVPSKSMRCLSCDDYEKHIHNKCPFNENFVHLTYDNKCIVCMPSSAINNCLINSQKVNVDSSKGCCNCTSHFPPNNKFHIFKYVFPSYKYMHRVRDTHNGNNCNCESFIYFGHGYPNFKVRNMNKHRDKRVYEIIHKQMESKYKLYNRHSNEYQVGEGTIENDVDECMFFGCIHDEDYNEFDDYNIKTRETIKLSSSIFDPINLKKNNSDYAYDDEETIENVNKEGYIKNDRKQILDIKNLYENAGNNPENEKNEENRDIVKGSDDSDNYDNEISQEANNIEYFKKLYYDILNNNNDDESDESDESDDDDNDYYDGIIDNFYSLRFLYKTRIFTKKKTVINAYIKTNKISADDNKKNILFLFKKLFNNVFKDVRYKIKDSAVSLFPVITDSSIIGFDVDFGRIQAQYAGCINMLRYSVFDTQNMAIYFITPDKKYILLEDVIKEINEGNENYHYNEDIEENSNKNNETFDNENGSHSIFENLESELDNEYNKTDQPSTQDKKQEIGDKENAHEPSKDDHSKNNGKGSLVELNKDHEEKHELLDTILKEFNNEREKTPAQNELSKVLSKYGDLLSKEDLKEIKNNHKNVDVNKGNEENGNTIEIIIKKSSKDDEVNGKTNDKDNIVNESNDQSEFITIDQNGCEIINETLRKYMDKYFRVHNIPIHYIENNNISKKEIHITSDIDYDLDTLKSSILAISNTNGKSIDDFKLFLIPNDIEKYDPNKLEDIPSSIRTANDLYNYIKTMNMKILIASVHDGSGISIEPQIFNYLYESNNDTPYIESALDVKEGKEDTNIELELNKSQYDDKENLRNSSILEKQELSNALLENEIYDTTKKEIKPDKIMKNGIEDTNLRGKISGCSEDSSISSNSTEAKTIENNSYHKDEEETFFENDNQYTTPNNYNKIDIYIDNTDRKINVLNGLIFKNYTLKSFIMDIMNKIIHVPSNFIDLKSYKKGISPFDIFDCLEYYSYNIKSNIISALFFEKNIKLLDILKNLNSKNEYLLIKNKHSEYCSGVDNLKYIKIPLTINLKKSKDIYLEFPIFHIDEHYNFVYSKISFMNVPENYTASKLCTAVKNMLNEALEIYELDIIKSLKIYNIIENEWEYIEDNALVHEIKMDNNYLYTLFIHDTFLTKRYYQAMSNLIIDLSNSNIYIKKLDIYIDYNYEPYTLYNIPIHMSFMNLKYLLLYHTNAFLSDSFLNEFFFTYNEKYLQNSSANDINNDSIYNPNSGVDDYIYEEDEPEESISIFSFISSCTRNNNKTYNLFLLNMVNTFYKIKLNSNKMMQPILEDLLKISGKCSNDNIIVEINKSSTKVKNIEVYLGNNSKKIKIKNVPLSLLVWKFVNILLKGSFNISIEDPERLYNLFVIVPKDKDATINRDYYISTKPGYTIEKILKVIGTNNLCLIKAYPEKLTHIKNSTYYYEYAMFSFDLLPKVIDFSNPVGLLSFYVNYKNENKLINITNAPENITPDKLLKTILLDMYSKWQNFPKDEKIKFSLFLNNEEIQNIKDYISSGKEAQLRTFVSLDKKHSYSNNKKKFVEIDKIPETNSIKIQEAELKAMQLYDNVLREILSKGNINYNNISATGYTISINVFDGNAYSPVTIFNIPLSATNKDIIAFLLIKSNHINTKHVVDEFLLLNKESFNLLKTKTIIDQNVVFIGELTGLIDLDRTNLYLVHKPQFNSLDSIFKNVANKNYDFKSEKITALSISEAKGSIIFNIILNQNKKKVFNVTNIPYNMYIIDLLRYIVGYQRKWIYKYVDFYIIKGSEKHVLNDHSGIITYGRTVSEIFTLCKKNDPCTFHIELASNKIEDGINNTIGDNIDALVNRDNNDNQKNNNDTILNELKNKINSEEEDNVDIDLSVLRFEFNAGLYDKNIFGTSTICNIPKSYTVEDVLTHIKNMLKDDCKIRNAENLELEIKIIYNDTYLTIPKELNIEYVINYYFINTPSIVFVTNNDNDDEPFNIIHLILNNTKIDMKNNVFVKKEIPLYVKKNNNLENIKLKNIPLSITEDNLITYIINYLTKNSEVINFMRDNTSICIYPECDPVYIHYENSQLSFIASLSYHIALRNINYITTIESFENFYGNMSHFEFDFYKYSNFNESNISNYNKTDIKELINFDINIHFPATIRTIRIKNFNINMQMEDLFAKIFQSITTNSYKWKDLFTFIGNRSKIDIIEEESDKTEQLIATFKDHLNEGHNLTFIYKPDNNDINNYIIPRISYMPALINFQTKYISISTEISEFENNVTTMYGFPDYLSPSFMLTLLQYNLFKILGKNYLSIYGCSYDSSLCLSESNLLLKNKRFYDENTKNDSSKQAMKFVLKLKKKDSKKVNTINDLVSLELNISCQELKNDEDMEECNDIISSLNASSIFWRNSILGFIANSIIIKDYYNNALTLPYIDYRINEKILIQNILEHINISPYLYKLFELSHIDKKCVSYKKELTNTISHIQCLLSFGLNIYFDIHSTNELNIYNGFDTKDNKSFNITHIYSFPDLYEHNFAEFYIYNDDKTRLLVKNAYKNMKVSSLLSELSKARCRIQELKYDQISSFYKLVYVLDGNKFVDIHPDENVEFIHKLVLKYSQEKFMLKIIKKNHIYNIDIPKNMNLSCYPPLIDLNKNYYQVPISLQINAETFNKLSDESFPRIIVNNVPANAFIISIKEYLVALFKSYIKSIAENSINANFYEFDIDMLIVIYDSTLNKIHKISSNALQSLTVSKFFKTYYNASLVFQMEEIEKFPEYIYDNFINNFSKAVIDFSISIF